MKKNEKKSALHITPGTEKTAVFNPKNLSRFKRKQHSVADFVKAIFAGDRLMLSQAITLIESTKPTHQEKAEAIVEQCMPQSGNSIRIGITGSPGVGKSTFIETFGQLLIEAGHQVAVLAIDPTSQLTQGSILGDKTRMQKLSVHPKAFVRPSPAGKSLGGVARSTRESILLCEAAGFDVIIVETVGVGQSEIAVHSMVDFFLLLLLPNAGDELQGIKRGVVEMADLIAVNKADGPNLDQAKLAKRQYRNALHLFPPKAGGWIAKAELCSGQTGIGLDLIWQSILRYQKEMQAQDSWQKKRAEQAKYWMQETIEQQLKQRFQQHPAVQEQLSAIEAKVLKGELSSFKAAKLLLNLFKT